MDAGLGGIRSAPLLGKKVYMHYEPGTRPNTNTERILGLLKAEIVQFFDRKVDYVITNVPSSRLSILSSPLPSSVSASSPSALKENVDPGAQSTPPVNPSTSQLRQSTILSKLKDSNNELQRVSNLTKKDSQLKAVTRGRAMLLAASKASNTSVTKDLQASALPSAFGQSDCIANNYEQKTAIGGASSASPSCRDLLRKAKQMGIKILTMEAVSKWIQQLPDDVQQLIQAGESPYLDLDEPPDVEDPDKDRICGVRHLTRPCVKVLDLLAPTRPLYMERTNYLSSLWQSISPPAQPTLAPTSTATPGLAPVSSSITVSTPSTPRPLLADQPLDSSNAHASLGILAGTTSTATNVPTGTTSLRTNPASRRLQRRRTLPTRADTAADRRHPSTPGKRRKLHLPTRNKRDDSEPSGYCECCAVSYKNLYEHVYGKDHRQFAENPENFRHLDQLLSELPSLADIFAKKRTGAPSPDLSPGHLYSPSPTQVSCSERKSGSKQRSDYVAVTPADPSKNEQTVSVDASAHFPTYGLNLPPPPTPSISAGKNVPQLFSDPEADADSPAAIASEVRLNLSPAEGELPQREQSSKDSRRVSPAPRTKLPANSPIGDDQVALSPPAAFACCASNIVEQYTSPQPSPFIQSHTSSKSPIPPPPAFADGAQPSPRAHSPVYSEEVAADSHAGKLHETLAISVAPLVTVTSSDFPMEFQSDFQECRAEPVEVTFPTPAGGVLLCLTPPPTLHPAFICRVEGWNAALSRISIASPSVAGEEETVAAAKVDSLDLKPSETSPVLQQAFRRCTGCKKLHIPTHLPLEVQMRISVLFSAQATCDGLGCVPSPVMVEPEEVEEDAGVEVCCQAEVDPSPHGSSMHVGSPAALSSTNLSELDQQEPEVDMSNNAVEELMKRESPSVPHLSRRPQSSSTRPFNAPPAEVLCVSSEMPPKNPTPQDTTEDASSILAQNTENIPRATNSTPFSSATEEEVLETKAFPAFSVGVTNGVVISEFDQLALADGKSVGDKTQQEQCLIESLTENESSHLGLAHDPSPIFSASPTGPIHSSKSSPIYEEDTSPMRMEVTANLGTSDSSTVCMALSPESSPDTYPSQRTPSTLGDISGQLQAVETSKATTPLSPRPVYTPSESAFSPSLHDMQSTSPASPDPPTSPHPRLRRGPQRTVPHRSTFSSPPDLSRPVSPHLVWTPAKQCGGLNTDLGRYQSPRRAAVVARQSIALSVQALYSPSRLQHLPDHDCAGGVSGAATSLSVEDAADLSDWSVDSTSCDSTSLTKLILRRQTAAKAGHPHSKESIPPSSSSYVANSHRESSRRGLNTEVEDVEAVQHEQQRHLSTRENKSLPPLEVNRASLGVTLRSTEIDTSPLSHPHESQHKLNEMPVELGPHMPPFEKTSSKKKRRKKKRGESASDLCVAFDRSCSSEVPVPAGFKDQTALMVHENAILHQRTNPHGTNSVLASHYSILCPRKRCYTGEELSRFNDVDQEDSPESSWQPKNSHQLHKHRRIRTTVEEKENVKGKVKGSHPEKFSFKKWPGLKKPVCLSRPQGQDPETFIDYSISRETTKLGKRRSSRAHRKSSSPQLLSAPTTVEILCDSTDPRNSDFERTRVAKQRHRTPKESALAGQRGAIDSSVGTKEVSHTLPKVAWKSRNKRPRETLEMANCSGVVAGQYKESSASLAVTEELIPKRPRRSPTQKELSGSTQESRPYAHTIVYTHTSASPGKKHHRHKHRRKSCGEKSVEKVMPEVVKPGQVEAQEPYLTVDEIASFLQRNRTEQSTFSVQNQHSAGCSKKCKHRGGGGECFEEDSVRTNAAVVNAPLRFRPKNVCSPQFSSRDSSPLL
uniref:DBF4-type domain-containing protein n=1 Tax=Schistocephalus solidus TaxID=70667 RepID=A0A0X3PTB4_SCHSO